MAGASDVWPHDELLEVLKTRVGEVKIRMHRVGGIDVEGILEGLDMHEPGSVTFFSAGAMGGVPLAEVAGFTLIGDPQPEVSDELGRS